MNKLTAQETAKVFAMYSFTDGVNRMWHTQMGWQYANIFEIIKDRNKVNELFHGNSDPEILFWRLPLTLISNITDEHKCIIAKMVYPETTSDLLYLGYGIVTSNSVFRANVHQQLIDWGYAVKLYPWGLTAIQLEIAIEKE